MIKSKGSYLHYLNEDKRANNINRALPLPFYDYVWKFLRALRRYEYHLNCYNGIFRKLVLAWDKMVWYNLSIKTGITVCPNCFEEGLTIYHYGSIVVNEFARGGRYVTLQNDVNIATDVHIGDNVYLAPGVKVAEGVDIPEGCIIGYNAVVTKTLENSNSTYVGIPAKKIKNKGYIDRRIS